jgi:UDP:flavonoid glycosyltransferase YjiC (YdhE family)
MGLRDRGHHVTIGMPEIYRAKVEAEGLKAWPLRPSFEDMLDNPERMARAFHPRTGPEYVFRHVMMPAIEHMYEDTLAAAREADFLVGHGIAFATPTVAEVLGKPWISVALQPSLFLSAHDPPVISGAAALTLLHPLGPRFWRPLLKLVRRGARAWGDPLNALRRRLGLRALRNPVLDDMFSPFGTHAWFSRILAQPQRDWPANVTITGFPFYDRLNAGEKLSVELEQFLDAGPPPVVFTLGSSAVFAAGEFFHESIAAAKKAGVRAILLVGRDPRNAPREKLPPEIIAAEYAPFSELLPRAAATVHQGGVGTTGQALRAGRPTLIVPWSFDQPDNAKRVERLGAGRTLARSRYRAVLVAAELQALLAEPVYLSTAKRIARDMAHENGAGAACDALEAAVLHPSSR